jgi:hypothetical protein
LKYLVFSVKKFLFLTKKIKIFFIKRTLLNRKDARNAARKKLLCVMMHRPDLKLFAIIADGTTPFLFSRKSDARFFARIVFKQAKYDIQSKKAKLKSEKLRI